jgi:hypothetical protein
MVISSSLKRSMDMDIIVSGSLAYDRIMNFPEYFSEHILPEKIHVLNSGARLEISLTHSP